MSDRLSLARAIVDLVDDMPARPAPAEVRAAWIARKVALMHRIAAETADPAVARQALAEAERSEQQASSMRIACLDTGSEAGS